MNMKGKNTLIATSEVESLSLLDLDIEELDKRLEMSLLVHPMGYLGGGCPHLTTCGCYIGSCGPVPKLPPL